MTAGPYSQHIGIVVEGPGDAKSLPILLRNWLLLKEDYRDFLGKPIPCNGRENATVQGGIEGYVATAASRPGCQAVLVVLDGEGDLVCELGPSMVQRARSVTHIPVELCLADRNWEDWLYASAETLQMDGFSYEPGRRRSIAAALKPVKYVKPTWQPRLTARMDISLAAERSPSLGRMLRKFDELSQLITA
ncbi:hypothetical protein ABT116_11775 [Streptomyces sp. NPDC002130]|uniref:hypothetical protein n=1 Tax=Streptomyces sp. NPDC002130 TaxID=3155568 RepID=UPI0033200862